jgi:hypothetical protein
MLDIFTTASAIPRFWVAINQDQADSIKELCEISWKLDQEIQNRKISNDEIESSIKKIVFRPEDQIFVEKYIFSNSEELN